MARDKVQAAVDDAFEKRGGDVDRYSLMDEDAERKRQKDPAPPADAELSKGGLARDGGPVTEPGEDRPARGHG